MNSCTVSGWLQGDVEERVSATGRRFINFEILVDSTNKQALYVRVSYFWDGDLHSLNLRAGTKVLIQGSLKFQGCSLFVGANEIAIITGQSKPEVTAGEIENAERLTK